MTSVAIGLAVLALIMVLSARAKLAALQAAVDDARSDSRRHAGNLAKGLERTLDTVRSQLADVAEGRPPSRSMILEGRAWGDVLPTDGRAWLEDGQDLRLLDVRTPQETADGIIPGALLIPVDQLEERLREVPRDGRRTLVYCAVGARSAAACEFLAEQGLVNLHNLDGGISSWTVPVEKPS